MTNHVLLFDFNISILNSLHTTDLIFSYVKGKIAFLIFPGTSRTEVYGMPETCDGLYESKFSLFYSLVPMYKSPTVPTVLYLTNVTVILMLCYDKCHLKLNLSFVYHVLVLPF